MSYRSAKKLKLRILKVRSFLDRVCDPPSRWLRLCGHGRRHNWSVIVAEFFFNPCACCLIWRGFTIGLVSGTVFALAALTLFKHGG